jgi:hypothetical protein
MGGVNATDPQNGTDNIGAGKREAGSELAPFVGRD